MLLVLFLVAVSGNPSSHLNGGGIQSILDHAAASTVDSDIVAGLDDGTGRRFMPTSVDQTVIDINAVHITMHNNVTGGGVRYFTTTTMDSDV